MRVSEQETMKIAAILDRYAQRNGKDPSTMFNEWIEWLCKQFELKNIFYTDKEYYEGMFKRAKEDNEEFFEAMLLWIEIFYTGVQSGAWDSFGYIYELCYQSGSKASKLGQFFTPSDVSDLMAEIVGVKKTIKQEDDIMSYHDCACGSGRTLISAWNKCDKYKKNFFVAGDIDISSVNMCALNFMINGMVGVVERKDALTQKWYSGYVVNACKVPYANNCSCIERYDDEKEFQKAANNLYSLMQDWDVWKYDPKLQEELKEKPQPIAEQDSAKVAVENKVIQQKAEPTQLTLF